MGILDKLAYDTAVADKKTYEKELAELQLAVLKAELRTREAKRAVVIGFEGWDAAGSLATYASTAPATSTLSGLGASPASGASTRRATACMTRYSLGDSARSRCAVAASR